MHVVKSAVLAVMFALSAVPAHAQLDAVITGDLDIELGQSTTLTAMWDGVENASYLWLVNRVVVDGGAVAGWSGSASYTFTPATTGSHIIEFGAFNDFVYAYQILTVVVTVAAPKPVHKNHGQCVSATARATPSGKGKGAVVSEKARKKGCSCETPVVF